MPAPRLTQKVARAWKGMLESRNSKIRNKARIAQAYHKFKEAIAWEAKSLKLNLGDRIDLIQVHVPMPKSWSKKKKEEMNSQPHQQTPDFDNYLKAIIDALVKKDGSIWSGKLEKFWTREGTGRICVYQFTTDERDLIGQVISTFPIEQVEDPRY